MRQIDETNAVSRPHVEALDNILGHAFPVLDHGFIRVVDYMGDDAAVLQAARVSNGAGTRQVNDDRALIRYLMRHYHSTPFEMCEIKFHVKLPIFVARQWIRHRTANVNEYSARYSLMSNEFYIPDAAQIAVQSSNNKQGRGDALEHETALKVQELLRHDCMHNYRTYENLTDEAGEFGLARELARMNLTLNNYTQWYWKTDLHNFMHFLKLRADSHAQYEIRVYAEKMQEILNAWVPLTAEAFKDYRAESFVLSKGMIEAVRHLAKTGELANVSKLSKREWDELCGVING